MVSQIPEETWTTTGQLLRDGDLRRRVVDVIGRTADFLGTAPPTFDDRDFVGVVGALDGVHEHLVDVLSGDAAPGDLSRKRVRDFLVEVARTRVDVVEAKAAQVRDRYVALRAALAKFQGIGTVAALLEKAPEALCSCGFDRAFVSRVEDSTWLVEKVYVAGDPTWAAEITAAARAQPRQLTHLLREAEMMRRRRPMLVRDAQADPHTNSEIGRVSRSQSYVAAPVMPDGRIIGFIHADAYLRRRQVDEEDVAVLWLFAEGFGYALQRTALQERLRSTRHEIQGMARGMASAMDSMCTTGATFGTDSDAAPQLSDQAVSSPLIIAPQARVEDLLSRREVQVLSLMANGKSNGEIATHLVITEGTVKSHVKHILRKLRAANRAEAVFRFMRLTAAERGPQAR